MGRVSLVIPHHREASAGFEVLEAVLGQTVVPAEVVLIRSGTWDEPEHFWSDWKERFGLLESRLKVVRASAPLMPGGARNLGIEESVYGLIAFLDLETIPPKNWLERQLELLDETKTKLVLGRTEYAANSLKSAVIRDAIYGRQSIQTIPGSVVSREVFGHVGRFIPGVRAAEDTEWMIRVRVMGISMQIGSAPPIRYLGLTRLGLRGMMAKWRRNYVSSRQLQHLRVQTTLIWLVGYVVLSLVAFNWNAIIAGWEVDSPYYVDHVTKIVSITPIIAYICVRGFFIPFRRGVPMNDLLPTRFLLLAGVGALLDGTKFATISVMKVATAGLRL